ncbi:MAG: zeta toxin family protein [Alphaproteobacteria bacterium]|nr:zeta toxin family protein [Alphaproteobacteria bacterium]
MDNQPVFIVFAGPNGSGKSTLKLRAENDPDFPACYINADEIKKNSKCTDLEAQATARQACEDAVAKKEPFAFETVFSHISKLALMERAKQASYWVQLHFVCLQDAEINVARVHKRVATGGHPVPEDKIISRYPNSMRLLSQSFAVADEALVFNNSWTDPKLIARKTSDGKPHIYPNPESRWTKEEIQILLGISERPLSNKPCPASGLSRS